jgi:large subunit ribosomal protein L10
LNRAEKQDFVSDFAKGLSGAQAFALLSFNKLSVEQMTSLRLSLSKNKIKAKVVKNTLAKRVLGETTYKELNAHLKGPTLIVYGEQDPVITAKSIVEWIGKENFELKLKGGAALGQIMSDAQFKALSKLPGRNELYVSFLWALKSHPTRFLNALQDTPRKLGYALGALKAKKEKESGQTA